MSGGGRHHSGRSSRRVDGGAGQRKSFCLQLGHEKSHIEKVITEQSLKNKRETAMWESGRRAL